MRHALNPALISRSHFARYLVERGLGKDVKSIFTQYLRRGTPGYVPHQWATLQQAVSWITGAGGMAVIAHPGRYWLEHKRLKHTLAKHPVRHEGKRRATRLEATFARDKAVRDLGGDMHLVCTSRRIARVLSITSLDEVFSIHDSMDAAILSLAAA